MKKDSNNQLGRRLRGIRKTLKMKQAEFATKLNISIANLSDIETGKTKPRYEFYKKISEIFGVNLNFLISGKGTQFYAETANDFAGETEDEKKFLEYFSKSKQVRYHVLGYFERLLREDRSSIEKEVEGR